MGSCFATLSEARLGADHVFTRTKCFHNFIIIKELNSIAILSIFSGIFILFTQGILTEGEGSVQLTSSLR